MDAMKVIAKTTSAQKRVGDGPNRGEEDRRIVLERLKERGEVTADTSALLHSELQLGSEMSIARFNSAVYMLAQSGHIRYSRRRRGDLRSYEDGAVRPIKLTVL